MKSRWKNYLLYSSLIIILIGVVYLIVETIQAKNTGFETKTLWDWMELLIIPLVLAIGAFFLQRSERIIERETANKRADLEREIAKDRQQETALQAYLDRMSELLLEKKLRTTKNKEVRDVARTRTVLVMRVLDTKRNNLVIEFLRQAELINDENSILNEANLSGMDLRDLNFTNVYMQETYLINANLEGAILASTHLEGAFLRGANLAWAVLAQTHLERAILTDAKNVTDRDLSSCFLKRTFMPNGTYHE